MTMRMSVNWLRIAPVLGALTIAMLAGLGPGISYLTTNAQDATTITIADFAFSPGQITVTAGTTVTWVNNDAAPHTATGDAGEFDTGQIASGGSASITFDTPGTYAYHCSIHPNMTATLIVQAAAVDDAGEETATDLPSTGVGAPISDPFGGAAFTYFALLTSLILGLTGWTIHRRSA